MKQLKVKILENKKVSRDFYKMRIESSYLVKNSRPGQFVEVKCSDKNGPLLRRPLGVHRILKDGIEMLYEIVGKGTEALSKKRRGEYLDIIGPLGNGFDFKGTGDKGQGSIVLVAGGVGVAPLFALAEKLRKNKRKVDVIIGAKTKSHVLCEKKFKSLGCFTNVATEDGSGGHKGLATDLLKIVLPTPSSQLSTIYACGPAPMLKAVAKIAWERKIRCQVSLEERMACGVGACLGCPVRMVPNTEHRTPNPEYKMVCKDGPVFDAEEIVW